MMFGLHLADDVLLQFHAVLIVIGFLLLALWVRRGFAEVMLHEDLVTQLLQVEVISILLLLLVVPRDLIGDRRTVID
jgi:hypothetical protein